MRAHARRSSFPLFLDRLILFAHEPWIDISWPAAIRDVTGHIVKGTGLLAGRAFLGWGFCPKRVTTISTLPLRHLNHLPPSNSEFGFRNAEFKIGTTYSEIPACGRQAQSAFRNWNQSS